MAKRLVILLCALLLSSGAVCMSFVHTPSPIGWKAFILFIPFSLMNLLEIYLITKVYVINLLDKGRYILYGFLALLTSYFIDIISVWIAYACVLLFNLPPFIPKPWEEGIWLGGISASVAGVLVCSGIALWELYNLRLKEDRQIESMKQSLEEKIKEFRGKIRLGEVNRLLKSSIEEIRTDPKKANESIRALSEYLRRQLYEGRDIHSREENLIKSDVLLTDRRGEEFLVSKKYKLARHLIFAGFLLILSLGLLINEGGIVKINSFILTFVTIFFVAITGLMYLNVYIIFPWFVRKGRIKAYAGLLFSLMVGFGVVIFFAAWKGETLYNDFGLPIPWFVLPVAIFSNMFTFFLMFAGSASLVLIRNNLKGKWLLSRLAAEKAKVEFESLQQQVNPHFLFNVLNNAGILIYENPEEAADTLSGFGEFLEYMLEETRRDYTTVGEEMDFLSNYIIMEKSSGIALAIQISVEDNISQLKLPPLLLIPFVENAVKHSLGSGTGRRMEIDIFKNEKYLVFHCVNTIGKGIQKISKGGGLGLKNTRRRLELLYGDRFSLQTGRVGDEYEVELKLPLEE